MIADASTTLIGQAATGRGKPWAVWTQPTVVSIVEANEEHSVADLSAADARRLAQLLTDAADRLEGKTVAST
jgi:hypothetical protein